LGLLKEHACYQASEALELKNIIIDEDLAYQSGSLSKKLKAND
jgi:hypothetical protein